MRISNIAAMPDLACFPTLHLGSKRSVFFCAAIGRLPPIEIIANALKPDRCSCCVLPEGCQLGYQGVFANPASAALSTMQ